VAWPGSRDPVNVWALDGNSSKMAKGTNFKFGMHAPRQSPDKAAGKILEKGAWPGSRGP